MNDIHEQEISQGDTAPDNAGATQPVLELPGYRLRAQRESNHLSLEEVGHHLRLDAQLIKALENDDYSRLPSPAYICGYLRSYARLLKLPEDEVVLAYSHGKQINAELIPSIVKIVPKKTSNLGLIKAFVIIVIIVLVAGGMYLVADKFDFFGVDHSQKSSELKIPAAVNIPEQQTKEPAPETAPEPQPSTAAGPEPQQDSPAPEKVEAGKTVIENLPTPTTKIPDMVAPETSPQVAVTDAQTPQATRVSATVKHNDTSDKTAQLRLHFNGDSWVEVTDSTGASLVYHLVEKDTDLNLNGQPPFTVLLGNAPEVQVFFAGKEFDHSRFRRGEIATFKVGVK